MELGIESKKAVVCASSQGLGLACAQALYREGCEVWINGRDESKLKEVAARFESGSPVHYVVADLDTPSGRAAIIEACPAPDILVNNNGGPPPGVFQNWDSEDWQGALDSNLLAPTFLIQAMLPGMCERQFGRIVNITSAMVKTPHPAMGLSTAARSGLTALCKGLSKQVAQHNVTINNLLPERFDTARQTQMAQVVAQLKGISLEEARQEQVASIAAGRLGIPAEFGDACAFLCSAQAGFISGQNLQMDGGSYDGLI